MTCICCDRFDAAHPGEVFARVTPESEEDTFTLWAPNTLLPQSATDAVVPAGLNPQRQWYLYNSIREFVKDNDKDTLCPLPSVPWPTTRQKRDSSPPPPKKASGGDRGARCGARSGVRNSRRGGATP